MCYYISSLERKGDSNLILVEETQEIYKRTLIQLAFIYQYTVNDMSDVLNECGSFDKLIVMALVAKHLDLNIVTAWKLYKEGSEEVKKAEGEVIQLWKKKRKKG